MRKILIVSPREPSGATWLINCFLELGIKTYRKDNPEWMWRPNKNGLYTLNPNENYLKKWLPVLNSKSEFVFRDDIEIQWVHDWPISKFKNFEVIFFVRDPRDAIYSRYKRENPNQSYLDFIFTHDSNSLLNKIENWCLFNYCWQQHTRLRIYQFEEYKANAFVLLKKILTDFCIIANNSEVKNAIMNSTYEKALECEKKISFANNELINRAGIAFEWKSCEDSERLNINEFIKNKAYPILIKYGYEFEKTENYFGEPINIEPFFSNMSFYKNILFFPETENNISLEINIDFIKIPKSIESILTSHIMGEDDKNQFFLSVNELYLNLAASVMEQSYNAIGNEKDKQNFINRMSYLFQNNKNLTKLLFVSKYSIISILKRFFKLASSKIDRTFLAYLIVIDFHGKLIL